jgi:hypothetical protein
MRLSPRRALLASKQARKLTSASSAWRRHARSWSRCTRKVVALEPPVIRIASALSVKRDLRATSRRCAAPARSPATWCTSLGRGVPPLRRAPGRRPEHPLSRSPAPGSLPAPPLPRARAAAARRCPALEVVASAARRGRWRRPARALRGPRARRPRAPRPRHRRPSGSRLPPPLGEPPTVRRASWASSIPRSGRARGSAASAPHRRG